jgi:acetolactate synthase I/II/III large subunit
MKLTGAQIVWESLLQEGVDVVFGYPGGANLPIYDALPGYPIHHVLVRHEQGAAHMADGYARASGKVGVAIATSGPGATNLVTGIATAMMDSSPTVFITGQVSSPLIGYDAFQEIDVTGVTLPITKHNYLVTRPEDISAAIHEAFFIARNGRPGPVLVDIAKNAQQKTAEWQPETQIVHLRKYSRNSEPSRADLERAAKLIQSAKRPVILAGRGLLISGATADLVEFAEKLNCPVTTTLLGIGAFPAGHPLNLGMMGMHGAASANYAIQDADLLIALGMRFDDRVTGDLSRYAPNAKKVQFDIDAAEINKNVRVDVGVVGDLKSTLGMVYALVSPAVHTEWLTYLAEVKADGDERDILRQPDDGKLYAAQVIDDICRATQGKALIVTDVGQNQMWAAQYYSIENANQFITSGGLGTMGFGLPAAIGAKFAHPEAEVWLIVGDGGFQMTQAELSTAAQEGVKINIALINNGYLGMVRQWQELFYERQYSAVKMHNPDFIKIVAAHGLTGIRVDQRAQVASAIETARQCEGTALIEFQVEEKDVVYPMVPTGAELKEMIRRPVRIEKTQPVEEEACK